MLCATRRRSTLGTIVKHVFIDNLNFGYVTNYYTTYDESLPHARYYRSSGLYIVIYGTTILASTYRYGSLFFFCVFFFLFFFFYKNVYASSKVTQIAQC